MFNEILLRKMNLFFFQVMYDKMSDADETEFSASQSWCKRFMKRNGLTLWCKTSVSQKYPDQVCAELVFPCLAHKTSSYDNYMLQDIFTMNETLVWPDMVSDNSQSGREKKVTMKSTGHEKCFACMFDS